MLLYGLTVLLAQAVAGARKPSSFCVDYSPRPSDISIFGHEVSILDPSAKIDPEKWASAQKSGVKHLGYISLVEISPGASYIDQFEAADIRTLGENKDWDSRLVDLTDPKWLPFILSVARETRAKGFKGLFLDTADSVQLLYKIDPSKKRRFKENLERLVFELRTTWPDCEIVVNRGFEHLDEWSGVIDGVLVESVFATFDPKTKQYIDVKSSDTEWVLGQIDRVKKAKLDVYILDYVEPGNTERALAVDKLIREQGAVPFISTPDLQGDSSLAGEFKRKILVLYGHDPELEEMPQISSPLDVAAESVVQSTIEWMGYELVYHCIVDGLPKIAEMADFAGVILDDSLMVPLEQELAFSEWLIGNHQAGRKLLFLGGYPFEDDLSMQAAFAKLNLRTGEEWNLPVTKTNIATIDREIMDFETKTVASTRDFRPTMAPENAKIHLRLQDVSDESASQTRFYDAVYSCSWGGAILAPYLTFDVSEESQLFYVNIPKFLSKIWPSNHWPVPDVTTQDGLRIFYSHIDGDGFTSASSASSTSNSAICGEVMYEEVLKDLPYPITVSIVEAPLRAQLPFQKTEQIPRYHKAARKIFELPHVETASHSYSHPYIWDLTNLGAQQDLYATLNLPLKLTAGYPKIDLEREIHGSLDFIRETLAPADKPPAIMLWSGNCRPTPETVGISDAAGVENMNGGDTVICSRYPGIGNISGKLIAMRGRIQVLASNQNEFLYTNGWRGPFHGGFSQVVETFEYTEKPVRVKPVNVYYHFYSADRPAALKALQQIYDWCFKQELHAMTAAEYARLVKDSHYTQIFRIGENRWSMVNKGKLRTLRFANDLGFPDLANSQGITGFHRQEEGWTYVHTNGSARTELALSQTAPTHPYLQKADREIVVHEASPKGLSFTVGTRNANVSLVQLPPDGEVSVTINNTSLMKPVDAQGNLSLTLEAGSTFSIRYR